MRHQLACEHKTKASQANRHAADLAALVLQASPKLRRISGEKVRREKALDFSG